MSDQDERMDEILLLNRLTGRVHKYKGTGPATTEDGDLTIVPLLCDCDLIGEAMEKDAQKEDHEEGFVKGIDWEHLEKGIWEPAPCLEEQ